VADALTDAVAVNVVWSGLATTFENVTERVEVSTSSEENPEPERVIVAVSPLTNALGVTEVTTGKALTTTDADATPPEVATLIVSVPMSGLVAEIAVVVRIFDAVAPGSTRSAIDDDPCRS